jgi:hypothetical protein
MAFSGGEANCGAQPFTLGRPAATLPVAKPEKLLEIEWR